jgi:hypothetical protein
MKKRFQSLLFQILLVPLRLDIGKETVRETREAEVGGCTS